MMIRRSWLCFVVYTFVSVFEHVCECMSSEICGGVCSFYCFIGCPLISKKEVWKASVYHNCVITWALGHCFNCIFGYFYVSFLNNILLNSKIKSKWIRCIIELPLQNYINHYSKGHQLKNKTNKYNSAA